MKTILILSFIALALSASYTYKPSSVKLSTSGDQDTSFAYSLFNLPSGESVVKAEFTLKATQGSGTIVWTIGTALTSDWLQGDSQSASVSSSETTVSYDLSKYSVYTGDSIKFYLYWANDGVEIQITKVVLTTGTPSTDSSSSSSTDDEGTKYSITQSLQLSSWGKDTINYSQFGIPAGLSIVKLSYTLKSTNGGNIGEVIAEAGSNAPSTKGYWLQTGKKTFTISSSEGTIDFVFAASDNLVYTESDSHFELVLNSAGCGTVTVTKVTVTTGEGTGESDAGGSSANNTPQTQTEQSATKVDLGGKCPTLTTKSGGVSGSGYATRYWDCCKPSCSWSSNAGSGNEARQCTNTGERIYDWNAVSVCDGGKSMACTSQIPFTIDGCENMGFAFAAVPGYSPMCGRCFLLTFTGTGKYETKANHEALKGKKLLVMASNIGYDVVGGQFDIMIPGGGVGIFNGCASLWSTAGQQYGGLLSDCENSVGYSGDLLTKRKNCLREKCEEEFEDHADGLAGCLFLVDFMQAAGNPNHQYVEVECPDFMKEKY